MKTLLVAIVLVKAATAATISLVFTEKVATPPAKLDVAIGAVDHGGRAIVSLVTYTTDFSQLAWIGFSSSSGSLTGAGLPDGEAHASDMRTALPLAEVLVKRHFQP